MAPWEARLGRGLVVKGTFGVGSLKCLLSGDDVSSCFTETLSTEGPCWGHDEEDDAEDMFVWRGR